MQTKLKPCPISLHAAGFWSCKNNKKTKPLQPGSSLIMLQNQFSQRSCSSPTAQCGVFAEMSLSPSAASAASCPSGDKASLTSGHLSLSEGLGPHFLPGSPSICLLKVFLHRCLFTISPSLQFQLSPPLQRALIIPGESEFSTQKQSPCCKDDCDSLQLLVETQPPGREGISNCQKGLST